MVNEMHRAIIGGTPFAELMIRVMLDNMKVQPEYIYVMEDDEKRAKAIKEKYQIQAGGSLLPVKKAHVIVLTIDVMKEATLARQLADNIIPGVPLISVVNGRDIHSLEEAFPNRPIIRAANTAFAMYREGLGIFSVGKFASTDARSVAYTMLSQIGKVIEVPEEKFDQLSSGLAKETFVTAVFFESLLERCRSLGLDEGEARTAALQIYAGTAKIAMSGNLEIFCASNEKIRENVRHSFVYCHK